MPKVNTKTILKKLNGEPLKNGDADYALGEAIANILVVDEAGGKMKTYILAQKFMNEPSVDLDASDFALVKAATERTKAYTSLIAGQVLVLLEAIKE